MTTMYDVEMGNVEPLVEPRVRPTRLAIISSHPIQYNAPWFRYIAERSGLDLKVFYLWDFGVNENKDATFQCAFKWDVPLLFSYDYEFVRNESAEPGTHRFSGLRNPTLLPRVREYSPDAVLVLGYNFASIQRFIWTWRKEWAPLIFRGDSHRLYAERSLRERVRRLAIGLMFRRFSAFLCVGSANRAYFRYHGVPEEKLWSAPHAVDNERFTGEAEAAKVEAIAWKRELGIPRDHRLVLFAGKFSEKKRPLDLLAAYEQADLKGVTLLFVGAGPLEPALRERSKSNGTVVFAPFQNQTKMPRTYAAADLFVLPSFGKSETWGLAINEAMCLSRAVIASSHVGCAEDLVWNDRNGLVFPAGDVQALSKCLRYALSNDRRLEQWGKESRRIVAQFDYANATRGLINAVRAVINEHDATRGW